MLVLSRKQLQSVFIGNDVELTVVAIQGGRVKLGITAPKDISIRRSELGVLFAKEPAADQPTDKLVGSTKNEATLA